MCTFLVNEAYLKKTFWTPSYRNTTHSSIGGSMGLTLPPPTFTLSFHCVSYMIKTPEGKITLLKQILVHLYMFM